MKTKFIVSIIVSLIILSCGKNKQPISKNTYENTYTINGQIFDKNTKIIYLKKLKENQLLSIDSTEIQNSKFSFKGSVDFPFKAAIHLKKHASLFSFILANETINIELNSSKMAQSKILNSTINTKLQSIKNKSASIYQKIDYLFPKLQKARMGNDFKTLKEINQKIDSIRIENKLFLLQHIEKNPNEALSVLLLKDLWTNQEKDSLKLLNLAKKMSPELQKNIHFLIP